MAQNRNEISTAHNRIEQKEAKNEEQEQEQKEQDGWECAECKIVMVFASGQWADHKLKPFVKRFICANCRDKMEQAIKGEKDKDIKKNLLERFTINFHCNHNGCKDQRNAKRWTGKNGYVNWKRHYLQHHPDREFLHALEMKLCDASLCRNAVKGGVRYCANHANAATVEQKQQDDQKSDQKDEEWHIIDGDGQSFDTRRCLRYFDTVEDISTDQQRLEAVELMRSCLDVISSQYAALKQKMNACVKMRLFGPAFYYIPYRGNDAEHNKEEAMKRRNLFNGNQWNALMERIEYEQDKIDAKMNRRKNREIEEERQHDYEAKRNPNLQRELAVEQARDILTSFSVPNGINGDINKELLAQRIRDIQYGEYEGKDEIESKLKRCIKLIEQGRYKKADQALNDGTIADLAKNGNLQKLQSKFPEGMNVAPTQKKITPKMGLKYDDAVNSMERLRPNAAAGKIVFDNNAILWAMERDRKHAITHSIYRLTKYWVETRVPPQIRRLMKYAKGVPLGKEKNGIADYDLRPVVMLDSIMRVVDKLAVGSIPKADRKRLMGPYQVIGEQAACEVATFALEYALELQKEDEDLVVVGIDATNAYNSYDRVRVYELLLEHEPNLVYYFENLYGEEIEIDFDRNTRIKMTMGGVQGLNSTELFYGMLKWDVQQRTNERMIERLPDFQKVFQVDYIDDGADVIHYKYVSEYLMIAEEEYARYSVSMNPSKTEIVANTDNVAIMTYMKLNMNQFSVNFHGNMKFLGIAHGTDEFVMQHMDKLYMALQRKLLHIQLINNTFIRMKMLRKFMDYNKIIYSLKLTRRIERWIQNLELIYKFVARSILNHVEEVPTTKIQSMMTRKSGGLGLRAPIKFYPATRITALYGKVDKIDRFFGFDQERMSAVGYQRVIESKKRLFQHEIDTMVDQFNQEIGPNLFLRMNASIKHRDLLALMDKKLMEQFFEAGNDEDHARIRSLGVNGAMSWMDVVPNPFYGVTFTNQEFWVLLCMVMGAVICRRSKLCVKCGERMDYKGYHGLSCKWKSNIIDRHNAIRNELKDMVEKAGMSTSIEQKYKVDPKDKTWYEIPGIPGDLVVEKWNTEEAQSHYFDVVVGNVCAPSWIPVAKNRRLAVAAKKEQIKRDKYNQVQNFVPLAVETMGGMGDSFKKTIQQLAEMIAFRKAKRKELIINQLRKKIIAVLMKENVKCILSSLTM